MTEISLFQKRTILFLSWVNYVWLHLHSSQTRVKRLLLLWGYCVLVILLMSVVILIDKNGKNLLIISCDRAITCQPLTLDGSELYTSLILKPDPGPSRKSQGQTRPEPDIYFWNPI